MWYKVSLDMFKGQVRFLKSAVLSRDYPTGDLPEIAFVGRSNAGKSSLINMLFGQKLAKISNTPGKTTLLNFFETEEFRFVDMPGYGYAARGHKQVDSWKPMIETYMKSRECLVGIVLVMDSRRDWQEEEATLKHWFESQNLPFIVALSKVDKLNRKERNQREKSIFQHLSKDLTFWTSTAKRESVEVLLEFLTENWLSGREEGQEEEDAE